MENNRSDIEEPLWASTAELRANSKLESSISSAEAGGHPMNSILQTFEVIDDQMAEVLRRKSDAQRLRSVDAFWNSARAVIRAAIRTEHPDWSLPRVQAEIDRRISNGVLDRIHA